MVSYLPSVDNLSILKAETFFKEESEGILRALGEVPSFAWSQETETLSKKSNRSGVSTTLVDFVTSVEATVSITLDELSAPNMAAALMATRADLIQTGEAGATVDVGDVVPGQAVDLGQIDVSEVSATDGSANTLNAGVDYNVYADAGVMMFLKSASGVTVTYDSAAIDATDGRQALSVLQQTNGIRGEILLVGTSQRGKRYKVEGMKVDLRPSGDVNFISEEFAQLELEGTVVKNEANPTHPYGKVTELV